MRQRDLRSAAPITEALLDLQVQFGRELEVDELLPIHDRVRSQYPTRKQRVQLEARFDVQSRSAIHPEVKPVGFFFWSTDERQAIQARIDGFAFSRLRPYQSWQSLRDEARRLWAMYREAAQPRTISDATLRYINRIELPRPLEFEDYLATFPRLGAGYPNALTGYLMRIVAPYRQATVSVTQTIDEAGVTDATVPVILDILVHRKTDVPAVSDDACWTTFEDLRSIKNEVFFGSLTDKADNLFRTGGDQ